MFMHLIAQHADEQVSVDFAMWLLGGMAAALAAVAVAFYRTQSSRIRAMNASLKQKNAQIKQLTAAINKFSNARGFEDTIDEPDAALTFIDDCTMSMSGGIE